MSSNFLGITFAEQKVTPSDDAIIRRSALSDGILTGCELSYSGSTLTMASGQLLACGRQINHPSAQNWAVTDATSGYARILLTIDLSRTSTKDNFDQIVDSVEYAASLTGFPELTQSDINGAGAKYQIVLCVVSLGPGGITGIVFRKAKAALSGDVLHTSGGQMTGTLSTSGLILKPGIDYGDALPSAPVTGQLFFLPADVADEMGL